MTSNRLVFALLFLITLFLVIFLPSRISYLFFYITLFLPIVSIMFCLFTFWHISMTQSCNNSGILQGEKIVLNIQIFNKDLFIYPFVNLVLAKSRVVDDVPLDPDLKNNIYSISPRGICKIDVAFKFLYRGLYHFGVQQLEVIDFLGLVKFKKKIDYDNYITVYPKFEEIKSFKGLLDGTGQIKSASLSREEDYTEISGVRKYDYADEMKKIHWKLTAKKNELLVKTYSSSSDNNVAIIMDLHNNLSENDNAVASEDKLISTALSLTHYSLGLNIHTKFIYHSSDLHSHKGRVPDDFNKVYNDLAGVMFTSPISLKDLLINFSHEYSSYSNLIIITNTIDNSLYNSILNVNDSNTNVSLIFISSNSISSYSSENYLNLLQSENIYCLSLELSQKLSKAVVK